MKLEKIKKYLKEPYPYYYRNKQQLIIFLFIISILSFCFSYFFEPFVVNNLEHKINYIWILLIHAFIPLPIAYLYFHFMHNIIKENINWSLGKEIFNLSIILLIIGIIGFLIRDLIYDNPKNWSFRYFKEEIRNTFLIGFLLLIIVLPLNLERLVYKYTSSLKKLIPKTSYKESKGILISIKKTTSNEKLEFNVKDFLFAKVESNYTEIYTYSSIGIDKVLIRITLKELEEELKSISYMFKTHRSYLVNLKTIESISGNAQGYQLVLKNCSITVPVSRSKVTNFNAIYPQV